MKKQITLLGLATLLVFVMAHFVMAQSTAINGDSNTKAFERNAKRGYGPGGGHGRGDGPGMGRGHGRGMHGMGMKKFWKDPELVKALGLTDDQLTTLDDLDWKYREQGVELHADMQKAQLALEKVMKDATDEGAVKKAAKAVSNLHEQMFMLHLDHQLEIRKVLTDDQWKEIQAMPKGPKRGRGQGRGQGRGFGGGNR
jgi:Spy/CpxP family protein refolding chaperone